MSGNRSTLWTQTVEDDPWALLLGNSECSVEPTGLTVPYAHRLMRIHAHYSDSRCRQRQAALAYLVEVGHYKLSHGRR